MNLRKPKTATHRALRPFIVISLAVAALISGSLAAQDAIPDLSGNWWRTQDRSAGTGRVVARAPRVLSEHGEALMTGFDPVDDPAVRCEHPGAVRVILSPYPISFSAHDDYVTISYEEWTTTRTVSLTAQETDPDAPHVAMGRSVGRYEDGKLIIETDQISTGLARDAGFFWTSEEATLVEEYAVVEDNTILTLHMSLTDPVMLAEPWVIDKRWVRYGEDLLDFDCILRDRP